VKDYRSVRDEIFRRAEVKKQNRRQKIVRGATVCLLLCLCLPVSLWAWQTGASLEEPPLYAPEDNAPGAPASGENEELFQSAAPDASGEPEAEASEEPPMGEEPIYSEEPWEEEPAPAPDEPEVPEGPGEPILPPDTPSSPAMDAVELPDGTSLEILLFPIQGDSYVEYFHKEAIGVIGVTVDGKWDPKQGYILITEGKRLPNGDGAGSVSRLETILEEADLEYPSGSLTVEEAEDRLFMLYLYYL
jgi:hypothetical protein